MKKLILTTLLATSSLVAFGQGSINVGNDFGSTTWRAPIFGPDPSDINRVQTGASSGIAGVPNTGSTVYAGPLLQGAGFTFQFWAGASTGTMAPLYTSTFRTATANKLPAGLINGITTVNVPGTFGGDTAFYQIRVWNNQGGTILDWNSALNAWNAGSTAAGQSAIVQSGPLGGLDATGGAHPISPNTTDWASFNIYIIPEPATFTLAGLGAAALLIFRRRK